MLTIQDIQAYLEKHNNLVESHLDLVKKLITDGSIRQSAYEYSSAKQKQTKETFNVFKLTSDFYYRENFHSDIIKALLDPNEKHNEGNRFLFVFLDMLNNYFGRHINKFDYQTASVVREPGKIDILICCEESKHCVIIENKIYNAVDMPRQLPRYYNLMSSQGYAVDAIVYLPLEKSKVPNTSDWFEEDKNNVNPRLCILPAYTQDGNANLVDNWLTPCSIISNNIDNISIFRQYGELVKSLNYNIMDTTVLTQFYESLKENDNLNTAISIREMLKEIPTLMAYRVDSRLKTTLSENVYKWKPNHCGIIFQFDGEEYKVDIWTRETGYDIYVFNSKDRTKKLPFSQVAALNNFLQKEDAMTYFDFGIKDEQKVFEWAEGLMKEIKELE